MSNAENTPVPAHVHQVTNVEILFDQKLFEEAFKKGEVAQGEVIEEYYIDERNSSILPLKGKKIKYPNGKKIKSFRDYVDNDFSYNNES